MIENLLSIDCKYKVLHCCYDNNIQEIHNFGIAYNYNI